MQLLLINDCFECYRLTDYKHYFSLQADTFTNTENKKVVRK